MNDALVPEWIRRIKDEDDAAKAEAQRNTKKQLLGAAQLKEGLPAFWKQLLKDLEISTAALPKIGIRATCSPLNDGVRIDLALEAAVPQLAHVNIWNRSTHLAIFKNEEPEYRLPLGVHEGTVYVFVGTDALNPERLAEHILRPLVESMRS